MLAAELFAASLAIAQQLPEQFLRARGRSTQISSELDRLHILHVILALDLANLAWLPSPLRGEGLGDEG
jgi:hypothetical protein